MNKIRTISFLIICLAIQLSGFAQDQIKILDSSSKILGRFNIQLYQLEKGDLKPLRGTSPDVSAKGEEQELILRLYGLKWFDNDNDAETVKVNRSEIKINDSRNLRISPDQNSFEISSDNNSSDDIKFKVYENGQYSLSIPFSAASVNSRFVQNFSVEGLTKQESVGKPIGQIADIKKAWKVTDKKDPESVKQFIDKYKNNQIAKDEGLLVIADRTLKRLEIQELSNTDTPKSDVYIETDSTAKIINELPRIGNNRYALDLSSLSDVEINLSNKQDLELISLGNNTFEIEVLGSNIYNVDVVEKSSNKNISFVIDNQLKAELRQNSEDLVFNILGGVEPFSIEFLKDGEGDAEPVAKFHDLALGAGNLIRITLQEMESKGMDGHYSKVSIEDYSQATEIVLDTDFTVSSSKGRTTLYLFLLVLLIGVGGLSMYLFNKRKNQKREVFLQKAKELQAQQKSQMLNMADNVENDVSAAAIKKDQPPRKITITKSDKKSIPPNGGSNFVSSGKMKIKKREHKGGRLTQEEFSMILQGDRYAYLDLRELWPDTAIKDLFLSKECINALGMFLKQENLDKVVSEMEGAIPEVGGFLMGNHFLNEETNEISVTMDEFVPFVPEYHDVFKIEIGTQTLVQELGDAQDTHPNKDVIGWFHTHPGHGLFLSNSDLAVQRHFPQKYQIAMEIDSLSPYLDTAFFTRKHNGTINNVEHRKKGASWFSWKVIDDNIN